MSESELLFGAVTDRRYLLVHLGSHIAAIGLKTVSKVCDPLPVTRLPCVEAGIDGLVNFEGKPILQINLCRRVFNDDTAKIKVLVVVESCGYLIALGVSALAGECDELAEGAIIIDTDTLAELNVVKPPVTAESGILARVVQDTTVSNWQSCLVFEQEGRHYGFRLEDIAEILPALSLTPLAGAPSFISGIVNIRGQTRLVFDSEQCLGLRKQDGATMTMLAVYCHKQMFVIGIDAVMQMTSFAAEDLASGNIRDSSGHEIRLLSLDAWLNTVRFEQVEPFLPAETVLKQVAEVKTPYLVTVINGQSYALPLEKVSRVMPFAKRHTLHDPGRRLSGLVDLEGRVTPVFDIHAWLGIDGVAQAPRQQIVIDCGHRTWTVPVDEASELIELADEQIDRVGRATACFDGFCRDGERVLPLISVARIDEALS